MSVFPIGTNTLALPRLANLESTSRITSIRGDCQVEKCQNYRPIRSTQLAAFALLLQAHTNSSDISFLYGETSRGKSKLRECTASLGTQRSIIELLNDVNLSPVTIDQEPPRFSCMLLCTDEIERLPTDLDFGCSLVLAYTTGSSHDISYEQCVHYDHSNSGLEYAQRILSQFIHIRQQVLSSDHSSPPRFLDVLSKEDIEQLRLWHASPEKRDWRTIQERVADWSAKDAKKTAIHAWDGHLTRGQLEEESQRLAQFLAHQGCGRGQVVAILMARCMHVPVAMLAAVKAGAAFVILDQSLPLERLQLMTSAVSCVFAVASRENIALATQVAPNIIAVQDGEPSLVQRARILPPSRFPSSASPSDVAFVNFTSGSTGRPKAVAWQHHASCASLEASRLFPANPDIRSLHRTSYNFSVGVREVLAALMNGGVICIPSTDELANDLSNAVRRLKPHWMALPPALARSLNPRELPSLQAVTLLGEPIRASLRNTWLCSQIRRIENVYGSTEAGSCLCLALSLDSDGQNIGKGITKRCWIVDPNNHDRLMPIGAVGELILEGHSIAQGYMLEPEKTAAAFIESPQWSSSFGAGVDGRRWFKTGDLVRYNDHGEMLLLGRKDFQIKLRGQRIEPSEVEDSIKNALGSEIVDVIVDITLVANDPEKARLTAFAILNSRKDPTDEYISDLQRRMTMSLGRTLPSYMIPTKIFTLETFPKTASGKMDRRALREMGQDTPPSRCVEFIPTHESKENTESFLKLRKIWSQILKVSESELSRDSNWSELGGDSANAILLVQKAREAGFSIQLSDILQSPALKDLMQRIKPSLTNGALSEARDKESLVRVVEGSWISTTSFQQYCAAVGHSSHRALMLHYTLSFRGTVNIEKLRDAISLVVQQHDSLRLVLSSDGSKQMALSASDELITKRIEIIECNDVGAETRELIARLQTSGESSGEQPVAWRLLVSSNEVKMLMTIHHAIMDGTSMGLFLRSLRNAYETGKAPETRAQYLPYLERRLLLQEQASFDYWRSLLEGSKPTMLRKNAKSLADNDGEIANISTKRIIVLPTTLPAGATVSTLIKAAWAILVAKMVGRNDVVFYYLLNGRDETIPGSLDVVGCCATEVPMRIRISENMTAASLLKQVQDQVLTSLPHAHLGSDTIARECASHWAGEIAYRHSSFLLHQNFESVRHFTLGDAAYVDVEMDVIDDSIMDFSITSEGLGGGGLEVVVEASEKWYSRIEVERVADGLVAIMERLSRASAEGTVEGILAVAGSIEV